jgi:hypothetical protein
MSRGDDIKINATGLGCANDIASGSFPMAGFRVIGSNLWVISLSK